MAILAIQEPNLTGLNVTLVAANAGGDSFPNNGSIVFRVTVTGAVTLTFPAQKPCSFGVSNVAHDAVVAIAAAGSRDIGPFPTERFNDVNGRVQVTYTTATGVTVAAVSGK